jgi:hypothetical protein
VGGGGDGGWLSNSGMIDGGSSGGMIVNGGCCGMSGGRMDGEDGVGKTGGKRDGGAGTSGIGGMGTPAMLGGSSTRGIGGKNRPFWLHTSGRTANLPAEKTRALSLPWRLFGRETGRSPPVVVTAEHGAAALDDGCWSSTKHDVTESSRPLGSCFRRRWNLPWRSATACFKKTVRPLPLRQRTTSFVPGTEDLRREAQNRNETP